MRDEAGSDINANGKNRVKANKVKYYFMLYHIVLLHHVSRIISCIILYRIVSYHIVSYHVSRIISSCEFINLHIVLSLTPTIETCSLNHQQLIYDMIEYDTMSSVFVHIKSHYVTCLYCRGKVMFVD